MMKKNSQKKTTRIYMNMAVAPMKFLLLLFFFLALHPSAWPTGAAARAITNLPSSTVGSSSSSSSSLVSRLKLDTGGEETSNCWESLMELQACSGEIILFFLNGETYLGQGCCRAIRIIGHHCWPNLIDTLGFTDQESDVLEGYCDRADDDDGDDGDSTPTPTPPHHHSSGQVAAPSTQSAARAVIVVPEQVIGHAVVP